MIRTTLSFCALFGSLILVSKWLQETTRPQPAVPLKASRAADPRSAPILAPLPASGDEPRRLPAAGDSHVPAAAAGQATSLARSNTAVQFVSYEEDLSEKIGDASGPADPDTAAPAAKDDKPAPGTTSLEDLLLDDLKATGKAAETRSAETSPTEEPSAEAHEVKSEPARLPLADLPPPPALSPELADLRQRIRSCLAYYYFRPENVASRSPWGSMHWMLAYGVDSQLIVGSNRVNAVGYLNYNGLCNGQRLFFLQGGKVTAQIGVGVQGHPGQYLAMLAQSRVKSSYPLVVDGIELTVADLIEHEKETCSSDTELTFKLIALSHYLNSDETWTSRDGGTWSIPRLIREELAQPINGAACGGTHRLTGFSYAVRKREQRREPMVGQWLRAQKYIEDFHEYTFQLQNRDGSFSTEWFVTRADYGDIGRRVQTTGHIVEWLAFSLPKDQLTQPRMLHSVSYLTDLLNENRQEKWSIGPFAHALHALAIYDERVFGGKPGTREEQLAAVRRLELKR